MKATPIEFLLLTITAVAFLYSTGDTRIFLFISLWGIITNSNIRNKDI